MLLYLHGFNSSPLSDKARLVKEYLVSHHSEVRCEFPQLETSPLLAAQQAVTLVQQGLDTGEPVRIIGSSMGGYLASYLVERFCQDDLKAVIINPAVRPYELLSDYLGEQFNPYTDETYHVVPKHITELKAIDTPVIRRPDRFMVLLQAGDEVLDYRQAVTKYERAWLEIEAGGDHSFTGFKDYLPAIMAFHDLQ